MTIAVKVALNPNTTNQIVVKVALKPNTTNQIVVKVTLHPNTTNQIVVKVSLNPNTTNQIVVKVALNPKLLISLRPYKIHACNSVLLVPKCTLTFDATRKSVTRPMPISPAHTN